MLCKQSLVHHGGRNWLRAACINFKLIPHAAVHKNSSAKDWFWDEHLRKD